MREMPCDDLHRAAIVGYDPPRVRGHHAISAPSATGEAFRDVQHRVLPSVEKEAEAALGAAKAGAINLQGGPTSLAREERG